MCNLNIVIRKKRNANLTPFLMAVSSHSYVNNSHGDGIYIGSTGEIFKSLDKLNYYEYAKEIENSNVVFSFQRLATSGRTVEYVQPFRNDEWVFMHNGVMNSFLKDVGSDSWGFFNEFLETFNFMKGKTRTKRFVETIKLLLKDKGSDWYSIIMYDLVEKRLYYFRNGRPEIHFYKYRGMLYITTCEANSIFLKMLGKGKIKEVEIKDNVIYKITPTVKRIKVKELDEIKHHNSFKNIEVENETEVDRSLLEWCYSCGCKIEDEAFMTDGEVLCRECNDNKNNLTYFNDLVNESERRYNKNDD
jgi:hypothetical protein